MLFIKKPNLRVQMMCVEIKMLIISLKFLNYRFSWPKSLCQGESEASRSHVKMCSSVI